MAVLIPCEQKAINGHKVTRLQTRDRRLTACWRNHRVISLVLLSVNSPTVAQEKTSTLTGRAHREDIIIKHFINCNITNLGLMALERLRAVTLSSSWFINGTRIGSPVVTLSTACPQTLTFSSAVDG